MRTFFRRSRQRLLSGASQLHESLHGGLLGRLLTWGAGLCATIWFLLRVIPKPSRATYPCQRAAFPVASAFVLGILGFNARLLALCRLRPTRFRKMLVSMGALFACGVLAYSVANNKGTPVHWQPAEGPNKPMGDGKGIFPGRVSWVRDAAATPWHGDITRGHWWDEGAGINQAACDTMMSKCLRNLTGAASDKEAWDKVFRYYNMSHGGRDAGYRTGETIALKINVNNAYAGYADNDNQVDADPQSVMAMLGQLVRQAGVPEDKIVVVEAVRVIPDRIYNPCHKAFPGVIWLDSKGDGKNGRVAPDWHKDAIAYTVGSSSDAASTNACGTAIPERLLQATYLVNMALMKGHPTCGVTLTAKNHYGSINGRDHRNYINAWQHEKKNYNPFVDLIGMKQLGGKTILFMLDGLFACKGCNDPVDKDCCAFDKMFNGQWLSSYFMSFDPVAIDSVGVDFLRSEFDERLAFSDKVEFTGGHKIQSYGHNVDCDNYLHEAALAGQAPSGVVYRPDGVPLQSLGVHEHWNNMREKKYSRNLNPVAQGIELVEVK